MMLATKEIKEILLDKHLLLREIDVEMLEMGTDTKNYLITSTENKKYILKIYEAGLKTELKYELEVLAKLNIQEHIKGKVPSIVHDMFYINDNPCVIYNFIPGRTLIPKDINLVTIEKIAELLANIHLTLADHKPAVVKERFSIFDFSFTNIFKINHHPLSDFIFKSIDSLRKESVLYKNINFRRAIIHEDLSMDNILIDEINQIKFIDFSDSHEAEIVSDLSTLIKEVIMSPKGENVFLIKYFLLNYRKFLSLSSDQIKVIPYLIKRRTVFMLCYLIYKQKINTILDLEKRINREYEILKELNNNINFLYE